MRPKHIGVLLFAGLAVTGVEAASATPPPPPSPLVDYSCQPWGPSLVVWTTGYAVLTTSGPRDEAVKRTILVAPRMFARLSRALVASRFRTLRRVYGSRDLRPVFRTTCAVTYGGRTVVMRGGRLPRRLRAVVRILGTIVRAHGRGG